MSSKFGVAAFTPEDVEDAHRRHPASDLNDYAASRGLTLGARLENWPPQGLDKR